MMQYVKYAVLPAFLGFLVFFIFRNGNENAPDQPQCTFITSGWFEAAEDQSHIMPAIFVKIISSNKISWNKYIIDESEFNKYIDSQKKLNPQPLIIFDYKISGKTCQFASKIQRKINSGIDCKNSKLCGLGSREEWQSILLSNSKAGQIK